MKLKKKIPKAILAKPDARGVIDPGGRLVQVILDTDLRNGHDGLLELGRKNGVNWAAMRPGQYVAFINRQLDRFILLGVSPSRRGAVVVYYKSYSGRVDREEMQSIPQAFGIPAPLTMPDTASARLDEELAYKRARRVGPRDFTRSGKR